MLEKFVRIYLGGPSLELIREARRPADGVLLDGADLGARPESFAESGRLDAGRNSAIGRMAGRTAEGFGCFLWR